MKVLFEDFFSAIKKNKQKEGRDSCMDFSKVIQERRTIRAYQDQSIDPKVIDSIMQAATLALSWKNTQCWRFYVVSEKQTLQALKERGLPEGNRQKVEQAPCIIVACVEKGLSGLGADNQYANSIGEGWSYFDLGLAVENLCLEAYNQGLGTLIMGIRNEGEIEALFNIPQQYEVVALIALGYPAVKPPMPLRKRVEEVCTFITD